jgi:hypothetical protein
LLSRRAGGYTPFFLAKAKPQESSNLWLAYHVPQYGGHSLNGGGEMHLRNMGIFSGVLQQTWSKFDLKGDFSQSKNHISLPKSQFWGCGNDYMAVLLNGRNPMDS